jgi:hypothetical protein
MDQVVVDLSRFQFASTSIFHFFFVSLTVGLAFLIAVMETFAYLHRRQGKADTYDRMTNFFGHLFLINFAVGVVTGIVQEFQFGMNWSEFSFFVGNIFGVPLALEVLMAFFLESTFIGLWWFGKDRLKPWMRLASIWIVAIGTQISAFWIVLANAWMHRPVGYEVVNGQAVLISFSEVVFNYKAWLYFSTSRAARGPWRRSSSWPSPPTTCCAPRRRGVLPRAADRAGLRRDRHRVLRDERAHRGAVRARRPADEVRRDGGAVGGLPGARALVAGRRHQRGPSGATTSASRSPSSARSSPRTTCPPATRA